MSTGDQPLTVTLPRAAWVAIIASLSARPYGEVADLIEAIVWQAGTEARDQAPEAAVRAN